MSGASDTFRALGYAKATMPKLAASAGVSTRTLHKYFPKKAVLFSEVTKQLAKEVVDGIKIPQPNDGGVTEAVHSFAFDYAQFISQPRIVEIFRIFISEYPAHSELGEIYLTYASQPVANHILAWAKVEQKKGSLHLPNPERDVGSLFGLVDHHVLWQRLTGQRLENCLPIKDAADLCATIWLSRYAASR